MHSIMVEDPFISRAALFSARRFAAAGYFSPYSGDAFINHPKAVAKKVAQFTQSKTLLACAWLHSSLAFEFTDTLELHDEFGDSIAKMISQITSYNVPLTAEPETLAEFNCDAVNKASAGMQTLILAELLILGETLHCHRAAQLADYLFWLNFTLKAMPAADPVLIEETRQFVKINLESGIAAH